MPVHVAFGMQVRVRDEEPRVDCAYRSHRIGRIASLDAISQVAEVEFLAVGVGRAATRCVVEYSIDELTRCAVAPGSECIYLPIEAPAKVMCGAEIEVPIFAPRHYFVEVAGRTVLASEGELLVGWGQQDPNPLDQLRRQSSTTRSFARRAIASSRALPTYEMRASASMRLWDRASCCWVIRQT